MLILVRGAGESIIIGEGTEEVVVERINQDCTHVRLTDLSSGHSKVYAMRLQQVFLLGCCKGYVQLLNLGSARVRFGISAPPSVKICRKEIYPLINR